MKIKGIPIWEQYLEFIVLGVAVLVFLGFTAMQFIGDPNAVTDPRGETIAPSAVDGILEKEAERLQPNFERGAKPPMEIPDLTPIADTFVASLRQGVSPRSQLDMSQRHAVLMPGVGTLPTDVSFVEPQIPAPYDVVAAQYFDALPPDVVQEYEDLAQMIPAAPYDLSWITAAATFDLNAVLAEYQNSGQDGVPAAVPPSWYGGQVTIVDVLMERQELSDGHWTDLTPLHVIPGQYTIRSDIESGQMSGPDRDELVRQFGQFPLMTQIIQPEFYATRNASWSPPTEQAGAHLDPTMTEVEREIFELQGRLKRALQEQARVQETLTELGGALGGDGDKPKSPTGDDSPSGGSQKPPGGGLFGTGDGDRRDPAGERAAKENELQRRNLTKKLGQLEREIAGYTADLAERGAQIEANQLEDLQDDGTVRIWAHDLDVEPGHTYRYRFTVRVLNPYFKHEVHLIEAQKTLAQSIFMPSDASEWSQPILAKPPLETFVVSANPPTSNAAGALGGQQPGKLGLGQTSFEVYRFFDGRWWKERFAVEPGERVGDRKSIRTANNTNVEIDFGTDWYVMDIVADIQSSENTDRGSAAAVVLQSISQPEMTIWRHPSKDAKNFRRSELDDLVSQADSLASAQANVGGDTPAN